MYRGGYHPYEKRMKPFDRWVLSKVRPFGVSGPRGVPRGAARGPRTFDQTASCPFASKLRIEVLGRGGAGSPFGIGPTERILPDGSLPTPSPFIGGEERPGKSRETAKDFWETVGRGRRSVPSPTEDGRPG